jgi:hypothetical protein
MEEEPLTISAAPVEAFATLPQAEREFLPPPELEDTQQTDRPKSFCI